MTDDTLDQTLGEKMLEALRIRAAMKRDGASKGEIDRAFEQTVRAIWPQGRPWHYYCENCNDTGWEYFTCRAGARCNGISSRTDDARGTPGKYTRLCARDPNGSYEHEYVAACVCPRGAAHRPSSAQSGDDDVKHLGRQSR